jgi:hypothetical protein
MKNILTSMMLLGGILTAQAQAYLFEVNTGTYAPIDNATTAWGGVTNMPNTPENSIFEIPFYFGQKSDSLNKVNVNYARIKLFNTDWKLFADFSVSDVYDNSIIYRTPFVSECVYKIEGETGSRIVRLEFKNISVDDFETEFYSFQIWVHEMNNMVEYRYGPNNFSAQHPFMNNQLFVSAGFFTENFDVNWLVNPGELAINPTVNHSPEAEDAVLLNSMPTEGTIYRFYPNTNGIDNNNFDDYFTVKSSNGTLTVSSQQETIQSYSLVSINGQVVSASKVAGDKRARINTQSLQSGIYLLKIETEKGPFVKKLML